MEDRTTSSDASATAAASSGAAPCSAPPAAPAPSSPLATHASPMRLASPEGGVGLGLPSSAGSPSQCPPCSAPAPVPSAFGGLFGAPAPCSASDGGGDAMDTTPPSAAPAVAAPVVSVGAGGGSSTTPAAPPAAVKRQRLFLDETLPSFFRRLAWTPDGELLIAPGGMLAPATEGAPVVNATHLFGRDLFAR